MQEPLLEMYQMSEFCVFQMDRAMKASVIFIGVFVICLRDLVNTFVKQCLTVYCASRSGDFLILFMAFDVAKLDIAYCKMS